MTALAGAPSTRIIHWKAINWPTIEDQVKRLQLRIAKAIKIGRYAKAKALQWLLTHSFSAKLLAIKRVTQEIFNDIDKVVFDSLWRMLKRKHSNKNISWIRNKYFTRIGLRNWCFFCKVKTEKGIKCYTLVNAVNTTIRRHVKIKGKATPFDDDYDRYFIEREDRRKQERMNGWIVNSSLIGA
jgi:hypothetical protein